MAKQTTVGRRNFRTTSEAEQHIQTIREVSDRSRKAIGAPLITDTEIMLFSLRCGAEKAVTEEHQWKQRRK